MTFRKLVVRDGSGTVTLDKDDLRVDGLVTDDGAIEEQDVHVQRLGGGAYLVRAVRDGSVPPVAELREEL